MRNRKEEISKHCWEIGTLSETFEPTEPCDRYEKSGNRKIKMKNSLPGVDTSLQNCNNKKMESNQEETKNRSNRRNLMVFFSHFCPISFVNMLRVLSLVRSMTVDGEKDSVEDEYKPWRPAY
jgi:hypothetical protein